MNRDKINKLLMQLTSNSNWRSKFNELEDKLLTKSLDRLVEHIELKERELDKPAVDIFNLQEEIDDFCDYDVFELSKKIIGWQDKYKIIAKEFNEALDKIQESSDLVYKDIKKFQEQFDNELRLYTSTADDIDANTLYARVILSDKRLKGIIRALKFNQIEIMSDFNLLCDDLVTINKIVIKKFERHNAKMDELRKQIKKQEREKYKKLFHYKDLVKLAIKQGFEYIRSNGDHLIYCNKQSQNIAIIPAHSSMKYGTMMNVQKMIFA
ncbi:type II toxin-antitoxin system HicA family toxin [Clostridium sp.]|uniref:type II toxin-antitoxin system HicA family toxin n=1 Tax=Clostridium sp. TaxID=1506 RepID=UPI00262B41E6|nr:type II toxin-antitoxin system HicA family toxin [Clostridium sp.]